jgi:hypothetical protein
MVQRPRTHTLRGEREIRLRKGVQINFDPVVTASDREAMLAQYTDRTVESMERGAQKQASDDREGILNDIVAAYGYDRAVVSAVSPPASVPQSPRATCATPEPTPRRRPQARVQEGTEQISWWRRALNVAKRVLSTALEALKVILMVTLVLVMAISVVVCIVSAVVACVTPAAPAAPALLAGAVGLAGLTAAQAAAASAMIAAGSGGAAAMLSGALD